MATMVLALLAGAPPPDAAKIANYAAGVVVGIVGTAAIEAAVLRQRLQEEE
jgi:D-beta-D-heptose 7-phosphate kinase/D-beta-D-heptose 1-phosphate adenosyltransferase